MGDWYYIGHYGQLGPLTREQMDELVVGGVIVRDTYVWRAGMTDWVFAERCVELQSAFATIAPFAEPPPRPAPPDPLRRPVAPAPSPYAQPSPSSYNPSNYNPNRYEAPIVPVSSYQPIFAGPRSDKSRAIAGLLQILIPGVGRMYLGYLAYGVLQLVLTIVTCGFLWLWSAIDGIIIWSGGVKLDGFGRQLPD